MVRRREVDGIENKIVDLIKCLADNSENGEYIIRKERRSIGIFFFSGDRDDKGDGEYLGSVTFDSVTWHPIDAHNYIGSLKEGG